ncbi:hypothetical protein GCM10020000_43350 [Streptomyces olivoverticillatus]
MGVDGREDSRGSDEADDPPSRQVPGQGGPFAPGPALPQQREGGWLGPPDIPAQADPRAGEGLPEGDADVPDDADAPPSDLDLVARMRGGENDAYEELYRSACRRGAPVRPQLLP